jgi:hypothetical protein
LLAPLSRIEQGRAGSDRSDFNTDPAV